MDAALEVIERREYSLRATKTTAMPDGARQPAPDRVLPLTAGLVVSHGTYNGNTSTASAA
jgi:hypothetical protein